MNTKLERMRASASVALMARAKELKRRDPGVIGLAGGEPDFATPEPVNAAMRLFETSLDRLEAILLK